MDSERGEQGPFAAPTTPRTTPKTGSHPPMRSLPRDNSQPHHPVGPSNPVSSHCFPELALGAGGHINSFPELALGAGGSARNQDPEHARGL